MSGSVTDLFVSQHQLARIFRCDPRTVRRWDEKGLGRARTGTDGTYDLAEAVAWFREQAQGQEDELQTEQLRLTRAKADAAEFELERERGLWIHVEDLESQHAAPLAQIRAGLLSLAGRIASELPMPAVEAVEVIEPIVRAFMDELSKDGVGDAAA